MKRQITRELEQGMLAVRRAMARQTMRSAIDTLGATELTLLQLGALLLLEDGEARTVGALGEQIGRSLSATSRLVEQLVKRELLRREEDPNDRRARRVTISGARAASCCRRWRGGGRRRRCGSSRRCRRRINGRCCGGSSCWRRPRGGRRKMSERTIVSLAALRREHLAVAGGKAVNLGELLAAGMPVPDGFCLTTAAYREVARAPAVVAAIAGLANGGAAEAVRAALLAAPVSREIAAALVSAYAGLGDEAVVAVRSSATAEDLPDASFAGQQDTILGVRGEAGCSRRCGAAGRRCSATGRWRTGSSEASRRRRSSWRWWCRALVPASVAGVLFTADPLIGRRGRAVIDASPGLGEAVVSGAVNPDHFE
jgi:DNA-binding MarR family transcriptional regulator